jgi:hypothetical protein
LSDRLPIICLNEQSNMSPPSSVAPSLVLDMGTAYMKNGVCNRRRQLRMIKCKIADAKYWVVVIAACLR